MENKAALHIVNLQIIKADIDADGVARWDAIVSDTGRDKYGEQTSDTLFENWITRARTGHGTPFLPTPKMPFLGVAHYKSLEGFGEAGIADSLEMQEGVFQARGTFIDSTIGKALYNAVSDELAMIERGETVDEPIRISAGWWDIQHKHGDFIFTRKAITDRCPICDAARQDKSLKIDKVYLDGVLDHLASTRVPVNPRTNLTLEEKSMGTKKQDAASIVGDELAEELEGKSQGQVNKSDADDTTGAMVVKADKKAMMKTVDGKDYPATDFLVVEDAEKPTTWHLQAYRNGTPDHKLMGAAKAALTIGYRGNKYEGPDREKALKALQSLYKAEDMNWIGKSESDSPDVEKMEGGGPEFDTPMWGVVSYADAVKRYQEHETGEGIAKALKLYKIVTCNILEASPEQVPDKLAATTAATVELLQTLQSYAPIMGKSESAEDEKTLQMEDEIMSDVQEEKANLEDTIGQIVQSGAARDEQYLAAQEAIEAYALEVKSRIDTETEPTEASELAVMVDDAFGETTEQIAQVGKSMANVADQLSLVLAKLEDRLAQPEAQPEQKSVATEAITPTPVEKSIQNGTPAEQTPVGAGGLRSIVRRSVGLAQQ